PRHALPGGGSRVRSPLPAKWRWPLGFVKNGVRPDFLVRAHEFLYAAPESDLGREEIAVFVDREVVDPLELAGHPSGAPEAADLSAVGAAQDVDPSVCAVGDVHVVLRRIVREDHVPDRPVRERLHLDAELVQELALAIEDLDAVVDAVADVDLAVVREAHA